MTGPPTRQGSEEGRRPWVTLGFLGLCYGVTLPSLVLPRLYDFLGGIEPRTHPWQAFTAVFEHGWPGFPGLAHLALNTFLILECGRPCERLLGWRRFLLLSVAAWLVNAGVLMQTPGTNGSSMVIWAWGPPLFLALRAAPESLDAPRGPDAGRVRGILILMYLVLVPAMGLLPYAFGWRGNPLVAILRANLFHLVATAVGVAFALLWRRRLSRAPGAPPSPG